MTVIERSRTKLNIEAFGHMPERPLHLSVRAVAVNEEFSGGELILKELEMELDFGSSVATLPFNIIIPKSLSPCPAVILISEEKDAFTVERKWAENGYAVISLYYRDISENNGNFKSGISSYISPSRRKKSSAGKIAVWAWAAIRALEYAEVSEEIDKGHIGVSGKGIFGLAAMLAEAYHERFSFVLPESIPEISEEFKLSHPYLFSPNFLEL